MRKALGMESTLKILELLKKIAEALDRSNPKKSTETQNLSESCTYVWGPDEFKLKPVFNNNSVNIQLLVGIDFARNTLLENTRRFNLGFSANNALLWGARGMGKSSLIKAVHGQVNTEHEKKLILVEIYREDITSLPKLLEIVSLYKENFIIFCDDLSFDAEDSTYKSLKAILEGGVESKPINVIFYATSNRRHMIARNMEENDQKKEIYPFETLEEKISLSDRFGIWLGFHSCNQEDYLHMINGYTKYFNLYGEKKDIHKLALEWAKTRGSRSGRVAWQFIQDLAGKQNKKLI